MKPETNAEANAEIKPKIKAYLNRINFKGTPKNNYDTLKHLQMQHLRTVPYENLDIVRNIPLSMEIADIYKKVVERRRGGYCFELNGLFGWLLKGLGFKVVDCMARYLRDGKEDPKRRHRVLKVTCEDMDYLCDVGMGTSIPQRPIPLIYGQIIEQIIGQKKEKYRLGKEPFYGNVLNEWKDGSWRRLYSFAEEERHNSDFSILSFYYENHPSSPFKVQDMVHMFTENGRKTLLGREFKIFSSKCTDKGSDIGSDIGLDIGTDKSPDNATETIVPGTEKMFLELLKTHFGIELGYSVSS